MLEQKLFFTRNGEYTLWEKLSFSNEDNLIKIKDELEIDLNIKLDGDKNDLINSIYLIYLNELEIERKEKIENIINQFFVSEDLEKLDFNALLFKFDNTYLELDGIDKKIDELKEIIKDYEEKNLELYKYLSIENKTIDIKLTSRKTKQFKGNVNEQILNTELRIYSDLGLIIMTDYGDYTHKKSIKNNLILSISNLLMGNPFGVKECILTDMTLRLLLKKSKTTASKFKFSMEGLMDVNFKLADDNTDNLLEYDPVKPFYENYKLSLIRISMNSDKEKYITIDGNRGKLNSRSKTLNHKDIDEFMECLSEAMRYDYLNKSYIDEILKIADKELIMHSIKKIHYVESMYSSINNQIENDLEGYENKELSIILTNIYFYFLIYKIDLIDDIDSKGYEFEIEENLLKKIKKIFNVDNLIANKLYSNILNLAIKQTNILELIDNHITRREVKNVN